MSVVAIHSDDQFTQLTTSAAADTLITLYFHTDWAEPCQQMHAVFESLAQAHASDPALFLSVNADDLPDISESFDVSAVPYFVVLRNSTIVQELSGADPKELAAAVQTHLGKAQPSAPTNGSTASAPTEETQEEESEEELNARLAKLVAAAPVMLFMKGTPSSPACGFSRQLVGILRDHQVRFGFFDILKDDGVRQGLKKFSDWPTFPQLYMNGEFQGGLDIIKESIAEDQDFFKSVALA